MLKNVKVEIIVLVNKELILSNELDNIKKIKKNMVKEELSKIWIVLKNL